jgi:hypothetical protein
MRVSLLLSLLLCSALQYLPGPQTIQPATLTSPSGEWTARLEPSSKFGDGPSHVTVSRGGERVWEADVPMTMWEACLSDDGHLAGYAYSIGLKVDVPKGEFIVAIFAPDGRELLHESAERTWSPHPDGPPGPRPLGLIVQPELGRFVVRVADEDLNRREEKWWIYLLSTGESLGHVRAKDLEGSTIGIVPSLDQHPIHRTAPQAPPLQRLTLRKLATVPLQAGAPRAEGPVRDVVAFDFDAEDHLRLVRGEESGVTLLTLGADGAVVGQAPVEELAPGDDAPRGWHWLGDDRWLFTLSPYGEDVKSRAWFVDASSGSAREIDGFAGPFVEAVQPTPGGGFVLFGHYSRPYTQDEALIAFDRSGVRRWQHIQQGYDGADSNLYSVAGLAVEPDGTVVLLDNTRKSLQLFGPDGDFQRLLDLAPALGERAYFTDLLLLPDASWLVGEFHSATDPSGSPLGGFVEWHRLDADRKLLESFKLSVEGTGAAPAGGRSLRADRRGRLWTTDGESLSVSDETHVLRRQFGLSPAADVIEEPSHIEFDRRGHIAVVDRRSHAIHLFAPSGERERVLHTEPEDFEGDYIFPEVFAAPDGRVFVRESTGHLDRHLEFSAQGERVGWVELGGERVTFAPEGTRWAAKGFVYEPCSLSRFGATLEPSFTAARRPNGDFFISIDAVSCGTDGGVSVLSSSPQGPRTIDRYSPTGEALASIDLTGVPAGFWNRLSESGEWLLVSSSGNEAILVPTGGGPAVLVKVDDGAEHRSCAFTLSPDGAELWCATREPLALHRFALPETR